jgi:hypothetical protein
MDFVLNLLPNYIFRIDPNKENVVKKQDLNKILSWFLVGGAGFSAYKYWQLYIERNINPYGELKDKNECIVHEKELYEYICQLQAYRDLNPWLFSTIVRNIDELLFLEDVMLKGKITPIRKDIYKAYTHFHVSLNRLDQFEQIVKQELGPPHSLAFKHNVRNITKKLWIHLVNIFHMCTSFNPNDIYKRATEEVQRKLNKQDNHVYNHSVYENKWKSMKTAKVN